MRRKGKEGEERWGEGKETGGGGGGGGSQVRVKGGGGGGGGDERGEKHAVCSDYMYLLVYCTCIYWSTVQDAGTPIMSELLSAVASKMTSAVLGRLSKAG